MLWRVAQHRMASRRGLWRAYDQLLVAQKALYRETSSKAVMVCEALYNRFAKKFRQLLRSRKPRGLGVGSSNLPAPTNKSKA